eukprot:821054-Pelagomonas_calceolata.AAC.7
MDMSVFKSPSKTQSVTMPSRHSSSVSSNLALRPDWNFRRDTGAWLITLVLFLGRAWWQLAARRAVLTSSSFKTTWLEGVQ